MSKVTLEDRAESVLVGALEAAVSRLPRAAAVRLGERLGDAVRAPLRIRRRVVEENLRRAFPEATPEWVERVTRDAYRHLGREVVTLVRLTAGATPADILERTEFPAWASVEEARAEGRGVIFATGHFGNWEMAAAAVAARGLPMDAVVKPQRNPLVNARIEAARRALGIGTIDLGSAPRRIPRALAAGHAVGIVADQDARAAGVWVPFFGHPASTFRGPALFALRFGAPLFAAVARRLEDGRYRVEAERVPVEGTGDLDADVLRVTRALSAHLEREIRRDPAQYFWFHKRWKTPPPSELLQELYGTTMPNAPADDAR